MPSKPLTLHLSRDDDIYHALDLIPLTPQQLCKLSQMWHQPFRDPKRARERLATLASTDEMDYDNAMRGAQNARARPRLFCSLGGKFFNV